MLSMNVRLTPQQQEFVKRQVEDGRYLSDSEVVREGLRLLQEETEWKAEVRRKISEGMLQPEFDSRSHREAQARGLTTGCRPC